MQTPFDHFAKALIEAGLAPGCDVVLQQPASVDTLYADALVIPRAGASLALASRGLLGPHARHPAAAADGARRDLRPRAA